MEKRQRAKQIIIMISMTVLLIILLGMLIITAIKIKNLEKLEIQYQEERTRIETQENQAREATEEITAKLKEIVDTLYKIEETAEREACVAATRDQENKETINGLTTSINTLIDIEIRRAEQ